MRESGKRQKPKPHVGIFWVVRASCSLTAVRSRGKMLKRCAGVVQRELVARRSIRDKVLVETDLKHLGNCISNMVEAPTRRPSQKS
jgi:hypothetical protein